MDLVLSRKKIDAIFRILYNLGQLGLGDGCWGKNTP